MLGVEKRSCPMHSYTVHAVLDHTNIGKSKLHGLSGTACTGMIGCYLQITGKSTLVGVTSKGISTMRNKSGRSCYVLSVGTVFRAAYRCLGLGFGNDICVRNSNVCSRSVMSTV